MKRQNRIRGMIACLALLVVTVGLDIMMLGQGPVALSIIFGVAAGWAVRETLEPLPKEEEKIGMVVDSSLTFEEAHKKAVEEARSKLE